MPCHLIWVPVVAGWIESGRTPYVFTHTPDEKYAPQLARLFLQHLVEICPGLAPLTEPARNPHKRQLELY